jgi:hypothetical protein
VKEAAEKKKKRTEQGSKNVKTTSSKNMNTVKNKNVVDITITHFYINS